MIKQKDILTIVAHSQSYLNLIATNNRHSSAKLIAVAAGKIIYVPTYI